MPNRYFIGFMPAFDLLEFTIEDETLYFNQENCRQPGKVKTKSWEISPKIEAREGKVLFMQ